MYPLAKGDQLCPLGFHPQVRWPTRCKRCFRDYKEHGNKRNENIAASTPSLSESQNVNHRDPKNINTWASTQNLSTSNATDKKVSRRPSSWTSTPDLDDSTDVVVNIRLPRRRYTTNFSNSAPEEETVIIRRPPSSSSGSSSVAPNDLVILKNDSLAERYRKMQIIKLNASRERNVEKDHPMPQKIKCEKSPLSENNEELKPDVRRRHQLSDVVVSDSKECLNDVQDSKLKYLCHGSTNTTASNTTDIKLSENQENYLKVEKLQHELEQAKLRAERAERDKSDILLRRLASLDTGTNKTAASEVLKLQQKLNDMKQEVDELSDEKRCLALKVKEMEKDNYCRPIKNIESELRKKLQAAETLCEELMDENAEVKKAIRNIESEMDEMQDTFRDDQSHEYSQVKKELEQATKNCRILSFKLKKSDRKIAQLEGEKEYIVPKTNTDMAIRIKKLEEELHISNEAALSLQADLDIAKKCFNQNEKQPVSRKIVKSPFTGRESHEDSSQLLRDLKDSIEREADLKEQLKFAEEKAEGMRKKALRIEEENDLMMTQLKKLTIKSRVSEYMGLPPEKLGTELKSQTKKEGFKSNTQQTIDSKMQLDSMMEEVSTLRSKNITLGKEVEKITARELNTQTHLSNVIHELENEVMLLKTQMHDGDKIHLQKDKETLHLEIRNLNKQYNKAKEEITNLQKNKTSDEILETVRRSEEVNLKMQSKIKTLEETLQDKDITVKRNEEEKSLHDKQLLTIKKQLQQFKSNLEIEKKTNADLEAQILTYNVELQNIRKNGEKEKSSLETEIAVLKKKTTTPTKKLQELKHQLKTASADLDAERSNCAKITSRYETLHEEHILIKAQLTSEKDKLISELNLLQLRVKNLEITEQKLNADISSKNLELIEVRKQLKEVNTNESRHSSLEYDRTHFKNMLEDKEREYENLRLENDMNVEMSLQMKKDNEDLRSKLTDFERVNKVQTSINDQNNSLLRENKKLKIKFEQCELSLKSEVAATRVRYEQQLTNLNTQLGSLQRQCERFKGDRDTFKQLLEVSRKTIGELKQNSGRTSRTSNSGDEDDKSKINSLEHEIGSLEDKLCESRLEASKLKTELVSEKSSAEIKISEMTSRLNEYEENRLIGSGRTKIAGMKTKLELSWQKEREDQQRLLQETSTLARDLRQTLFEVERERDKERLETRRKLDQFKNANEDELEEGRRKISELQCDLLELRDAHAKLRTANEKLRRERERIERERETNFKRRQDQFGDKKLFALLQVLDELLNISPDLKNVSDNILSSKMQMAQQPLSHGNKSRSPSPSPVKTEIVGILQRLTEASGELRKFQKVCEEERNRERLRRFGGRRATSTESDTPERHRSHKSGYNGIGHLQRKSLSLDQSMQTHTIIWKNDDGSMSSMQSIDSEFGGLVRDSSIDSRLSGDSTQSDLPRGPRKKKRGFMGKLKSLAKGLSTDGEIAVQKSDSESSIFIDHRSSKTDLKGRFTGIFRRAGSNLKANSTEEILTDAPNISESRPPLVGYEKNQKNLTAKHITK